MLPGIGSGLSMSWFTSCALENRAIRGPDRDGATRHVGVIRTGPSFMNRSPHRPCATIRQMLGTTSDRHTPECRSARRGGLPAVAGLLPVVVASVKRWPRRSTWLLSTQQQIPRFPLWRGIYRAVIGAAAAVVSGPSLTLPSRALARPSRREERHRGARRHQCRVLGRVRHS